MSVSTPDDQVAKHPSLEVGILATALAADWA
jgi:hypothetical protein